MGTSKVHFAEAHAYGNDFLYLRADDDRFRRLGAALVAAASFGGAARDAEVTAPGGSQRVEWREDGVYLTGWAEAVCDGEWLRPLP